MLDESGEETKLLAAPRCRMLLAEQTPPCLSVTALFGDETAHDEIQRFVKFLSGGLDADIDVRLRHWSYTELEHLRAETVAAELAEQTDLLLLVTQQDEALPAPVARWIAAWLQQASKRCAAVCLVGNRDNSAAEATVARNLRNACEQAQVEFFISTFTLREPRVKIATPLCAGRRDAPCGAGIMHWGINE